MAARFFRYPRERNAWRTVPFCRMTLWTSASEEFTHPHRADSALHFLINSLWAWPINWGTSKRWFLRRFSWCCKEGQNKFPSDIHPPYWRGSVDRFAGSVARFSSDDRAVRRSACSRRWFAFSLAQKQMGWFSWSNFPLIVADPDTSSAGHHRDSSIGANPSLSTFLSTCSYLPPCLSVLLAFSSLNTHSCDAEHVRGSLRPANLP